MTDFEKQVLREVSKIPLGEVYSYKWLAQKCGRPRAWRAVANALKKNPFPLFIPCHRIGKSSNQLGGYSLGEELKKDLVDLERKIREALE